METMDGRGAHPVSARHARGRPSRVGILWRGEPGATRPRQDRGLEPLFEALGGAGVEVVPLPYGDEQVDEVRARLRVLDGVLVWVNPIQDGATRALVDELLRDATDHGVWVSAHPEVIAKMGTTEVLYTTRELGWGADVGRYRDPQELALRLPERLALHGRLVVKQGRGNGGNGVFGVELVEPTEAVTLHTTVRVSDARVHDGSFEQLSLGEFVTRCTPRFEWSGLLVDQPYQGRLVEGMLRCYFSHDEVVGFCHQWPTGLLDIDPDAELAPRPSSVMEGPDAKSHQRLRRRAEHEWVPEMARRLGLEAQELPVIWDADFLYGPRDDRGRDTYVLCEINVSAVWPFPPMAAATIALNTAARIDEHRRGLPGRRAPRRGPVGPTV